MGVFNGNSIYNEGGAGGGYNNGGDLTPADYIEIENNSFYTLEGNDAADLNFVIDGESGVLNSIVEVSTNVNSVVNVYIDRNGILYKLLCIDNSITAGKDYHLYIQGSNYYIEEIAGLEPVISKAELNGNYIDVYQIGPYVISADLGEWFNLSQFNSLVASTSGKWKKLSIDEVDYIKNNFTSSSIRSTSGWNNTQGDNSTGLNFYPYGRIEFGSPVGVGQGSYFWIDPNEFYTTTNYASVYDGGITKSTIYDGPEVLLRGRLMLA